MRLHPLAMLACCALLAACGDKNAANTGQGEDVLPRPAAASGSVTGMPNPGVASAPREPVVIEDANAPAETPVDAASGAAAPTDAETPPATPDAVPAVPAEPAREADANPPGNPSP